jgi:alkylated DNA nucleotide flippase Atl1
MKVQGASFKEKVLNIVHAIPRGSVLTYKEVAEKAGNSQASRVVGNLMACFRYTHMAV